MTNALSTKANTIDVNSSLAFKANSTDVYTKTQTDTLLVTKANTTDVTAALDLKPIQQI